MRRAWPLVVAACAGPARAPVPATPAAPHPTLTRQEGHGAAPRPSLDLAAVLPARSRVWPLVQPPSLEPHWTALRLSDACAPTWADRRGADARVYAAAWCRIRGGDRGALDDLGKLARDGNRELALAARLDAIDLAADGMDARRALAWLDSLSLATPETLDVLAATYVEQGMRGEAELVEDRLARDDPRPSPSVACERLLAYGKLDDPRVVARLQEALTGTGTCAAIASAAECAIEKGTISTDYRCFIRVSDDPLVVDKQAVIGVYLRWGERPWPAIARDLVPRLQVSGVEELAVTALENAFVVEPCSAGTLDSVLKQVDALRASPHHSTAYDPRLDALRPQAAMQCARAAGK